MIDNWDVSVKLINVSFENFLPLQIFVPWAIMSAS